MRPKALILTRASPGPAVGLGMLSMKRAEAGPLESLIPGGELVLHGFGEDGRRTDCAHGCGHD